MPGLSLGLGLGLSSPSMGGGAWTPARLFAASEPGLWSPVSPTSTYQGRTGTTPGAVGSPVGRLIDATGRGLDLVAPSDAARPILRQTAGGFYYLEFDGVDDCLLSPVSASLDFTSDFSLSLAMRYTGGTGFTSASGKYEGGQNRGYDLGFQGGGPRWTIRGVSAIDTANTGFGSLTGADIALITTGALSQASREVSAAHVNTAGTWTPTVASLAPFAVGRRGADNTSYAAMRLYGVALRGGVLTDPERAALRTWLASQYGAVL